MTLHKAMLAIAIGWAGLVPIAAAAAGADSAISPDGRWQAVIHQERGEGGASGSPPSSLWLTDRRTGRTALLFRGRAASDPRRYTRSIAQPVFSLDGGYVYVEADAYATSPAIHQVNRRTRQEQYVTDGGLCYTARIASRIACRSAAKEKGGAARAAVGEPVYRKR